MSFKVPYSDVIICNRALDRVPEQNITTLTFASPAARACLRWYKPTVRKLLEDNAENMGVWLTAVAEGKGDAKPDPGKALDLLAKLAEYAAPKLARTEHTGEGGGPVKSIIEWQA